MRHRSIALVLPLITTAAVSVFGQTNGASRVLADARTALGGESRLAAVTTILAKGRMVRLVGQTASTAASVEIAIELPRRFARREELRLDASAAGTVTRITGFNGDIPIDVLDQPSSGHGAPARGAESSARRTETPRQEDRHRQLINGRQELAQLTLGFFAAAPAGVPLAFTALGRAVAPDGRADVVGITGEGGFKAQLFIDATTHLPLMLTWMAKEPLTVRLEAAETPGGHGGSGHGSGGHGAGGHGGSGNAASGLPEASPSPSAEELRRAEQARRTVEYRLSYGDYREVNGIKVPFRLRRSVDGKPIEEVTFETVRLNGRIAANTFEAK